MKKTMLTVGTLCVLAGQAMGQQGQCGHSVFDQFDAAAGDHFGQSLAAAGNVMVTGSPSDDFNAAATNAGSRHIFELLNGTWQWRTTTADTVASAVFGRSVATDGSLVAAGKGGGPTVGSFVQGGGSVSIKSGENWVSVDMPALGLNPGDEFGFSAAVGGGRIAFGAPRRDFNAGDDMGAVFVYRVNAQNQASLLSNVIRPAFSTQAGEHFGYSVAIAPAGGPNAGMLVVGAPDRDSDSSASTGGIYVFNSSGQGYTLQNLPTQWDEAFQFNGMAVATNGDWIISGAPSFGDARGRVFLYQRLNNGNWEPTGFLSGPGGSGGNFGYTLAMSTNWMAIAAPGHDDVYVYARHEDHWAQRRVVNKSFVNGTTQWGASVAITEANLFVGDPNAEADGFATAGTVARLDLEQMHGGDMAEGAEWIGIPTSTVSCLTHATPTPSGIPGMCGQSGNAADVFFKITPRATGEVVFDTVGSSFDTVLSVHSMAPTWQDAHLISCNDDINGAANRQSRVTLMVERGEEYWVRVAGFNGAVGTFHLNVRWNCPADFNDDGFVDFFDYDDFVNCYEGGSCPAGKTADMNSDDFVDFFDYDAFVQVFEAGCGPF